MIISNKINWNINKVKEFLLNKSYELLDSKYINALEKLTIKDTSGYVYYISLMLFIRCKKPRMVDKNNPYTVQNIKNWCKLNNKPFELISEIYENAHKKLEWKCLRENCGEIFEACWNNIKNNNGMFVLLRIKS